MNIACKDFKDHEDEGRFRTYDLEAEGETLDELLDSAVYQIVDQDGGSMGDRPADDDRAIEYITEEFNRRKSEARKMIFWKYFPPFCATVFTLLAIWAIIFLTGAK